jgi:hypothetical protein
MVEIMTHPALLTPKEPNLAGGPSSRGKGDLAGGEGQEREEQKFCVKKKEEDISILPFTASFQPNVKHTRNTAKRKMPRRANRKRVTILIDPMYK